MYTEIEIEGWPVSLKVALQKEEILEAKAKELLDKLDAYLEEQGLIVDREDTKRYTSSVKLAAVLFDDLGLPVSSNPQLAFTDETCTVRSTEAEALLHIRKHEWVVMLSKWKKINKALSTYVRPMIQQAKNRGKLSTSYKLSGTATGRSASGKEDKKGKKGDSMNLQNLPYIENLKEIVRATRNPVTGQRRLIGEADLSQIELRIVAELSGDPLMVWAYRNNVDLHSYRAIRNLGVDKDLLQQGLNIDSWRKVLKEGGWAQLDPAVQKEARKKAKPCIAKGALVLTDNGLKPIETVQLADRVWDGVEWVNHEGVVYKGFKPVLTHSGLTATPKHKVYLEDGSIVPFKDVVDEKARSRIAITEIDGIPVRYVDVDRRTRAQNPTLGCVSGVRGLQTTPEKKAHVYDIVNAGPRHRFTANGLLLANCNFGYTYGMWYTKFVTYAAKSYGLDFTNEEAKANRNTFFADHIGLEPWYKRVAATGRKYGYVESLSGRKRHLPALQLKYEGSKEKERLYKDAVRQAINSPVQSFGSGDLKLMAMLGIRKEMKRRGWYGTKMMVIGEVHDSILYWVDEDIAVECTKIIVELMKHPPLLDELGIEIRVPIEAEAALGRSLGTTVSLEEYEMAS